MPDSRSLARTVLIAALAMVFGVAATFLLTLAIHGPFQFIWSVHSPINAESIVAISFLLLIILNTRKEGMPRAARGSRLLSLSAAILTAFAFVPTIDVPLLHDSYTHVWEALTENWSQVAATFAPHGAAFIRPLGYLSYFIDAHWAGSDPFRWHLGNVVLHALNTALAYWLILRLTRAPFTAAITAFVFGVHGTRPEAVTWVAARYDLLAVVFVLLALIASDAYAETRRNVYYVLMLLAAVCAVFSKESAYCLPLLAALLAPFKAPEQRRRIFYAAGGLALTYGLALLYRLHVLGDVGGYRDAPGHTEVLHFNLIHSLKALLQRQWSFLFFPLNWSVDRGALFLLGIVLLLGTLVGMLLWSRAERGLIGTAIGWVLAAALPVQHLLLLNADMGGARVLYLPTLGLALLFALLLNSISNTGRRWLLTAALLTFECMALLHNQAIWRDVAYLSKRSCEAAGAEISRSSGLVFFRDLPPTYNGVFFLQNGFPYCVQFNSGVAEERVHVIGANATHRAGKRVYRWDEKSLQFQQEPELR